MTDGDQAAAGQKLTTRVTNIEVNVLPDLDHLALAVAERLIRRLIALQGGGRIPRIALTGGRTGIAVLHEIRNHPARDSIMWDKVEVFWGDDRFVPCDHDDRNEKQARDALLNHVGVDAFRVHAMSPLDGEHGDDVDAAAHSYDRVLRAAGQRDGALFDVCLLGVGEEGHIASIFPGSPAVEEPSARAVAVRGCPKPPRTRISLTLACIQDSHEVWLITTGITKAAAVSAALSGSAPAEVPAAGAVGTGATLWFLDTDAASEYLGSQ